jgi:hypothetical protein
MKCISEALIQKYIDKEATAKEVTFIKNHISGCASCSRKIEEYRESAKDIKRLIGLLDEKEIEVPEFNRPVPQKNITPAKLKIFMYSAVAASILILFLVLTQKQKSDIEIIYSYDLESEFNANLPVSDQDMVIQIMDSEGNLLNY